MTEALTLFGAIPVSTFNQLITDHRLDQDPRQLRQLASISKTLAGSLTSTAKDQLAHLITKRIHLHLCRYFTCLAVEEGSHDSDISLALAYYLGVNTVCSLQAKSTKWYTLNIKEGKERDEKWEPIDIKILATRTRPGFVSLLREYAAEATEKLERATTPEEVKVAAIAMKDWNRLITRIDDRATVLTKLIQHASQYLYDNKFIYTTLESYKPYQSMTELYDKFMTDVVSPEPDGELTYSEVRSRFRGWFQSRYPRVPFPKGEINSFKPYLYRRLGDRESGHWTGYGMD